MLKGLDGVVDLAYYAAPAQIALCLADIGGAAELGGKVGHRDSRLLRSAKSTMSPLGTIRNVPSPTGSAP